jgi:hypothetical protein
MELVTEETFVLEPASGPANLGARGVEYLDSD